MSRSQVLLDWLERAGDWLNPLVVKEVRQLGRGREFHYSFSAALLIGLGVAFFGAADALTGNGTSGRWTFGALMGVLALLGLIVVPLSAFNALRNERLEQTLELITLTALSPRRVVIGKLLAQAVKLATLFAGLAPFIAMSFLLGGIDFMTILLWMFVLFTWSLCVSAGCLFLSSLPKTRAVSSLVFGGLGVLVLLVLIVFAGPRLLFMVMTRGAGMSGGSFGIGIGGSGASPWWTLAITTTFCLSLMANFVLLAENRLSLQSDNRVTALRLGFFAQLLLMAGWALSFAASPTPVPAAAGDVLLWTGGLHLAIVAAFTVTEDLTLPRRVLLRRKDLPAWRRLFAPFQPGGGNGAVYVLLQMILVLSVGSVLESDWSERLWFLAACGYICFFTGVPVAIVRLLRPLQPASFYLRVAVLVLVAGAMIGPDILAYMVWQPDGLDLSFSFRHLVNPFRTLANWTVVESTYGYAVPLALGLTGLVAYTVLMGIGARVMLQPLPIQLHAVEAPAGEPGSADVVY